MRFVTQTHQLNQALAQIRKKPSSIGFVPTMGALHAGHAALMQAAAQENDYVVVSIFVNPLQFGPQEDLKQYPRNLKKDLEFCRRRGADLVFAPDESILKSRLLKREVVPRHANGMCGRRRPGHFQGVVQIVGLLFRLIRPTRAYFGQKDYQQARVIDVFARRFFRKIEVCCVPTVRESDGLALSSRNLYLTKQGRRKACALYRSLAAGGSLIQSGIPPKQVQENILRALKSAGVSDVDYVDVRDSFTLKSLSRYRAEREVLIAGAVYIGKTRIIDNVLIQPRVDRMTKGGYRKGNLRVKRYKR